eukprot:Pgem_evm1s14296
MNTITHFIVLLFTCFVISFVNSKSTELLNEIGCTILEDDLDTKILKESLFELNNNNDNKHYDDAILWENKVMNYDIDKDITNLYPKIMEDIFSAFEILDDAFGDCIAFKRTEKSKRTKQHVMFSRPTVSMCASQVGRQSTPQVIR